MEQCLHSRIKRVCNNGKEDKLNKINDLMELFELNRKFYFGKESIDSYLSEKLDYSAIEEK